MDNNQLKFTVFFERLKAVTSIKTQVDLAKALNLGKATISIAKNKNQVPAKWVLQIAELFDLNASWLYSGMGEPFTRQTPKHDDPSLAKSTINILVAEPSPNQQGGLKFHASENGQTHIVLKKKLDSKFTGQAIVIKMNGPAMEPTIRSGEYLIVDLGQQHPLTDEVVLVELNQEVYVRRIERQPEQLILYADNPVYTPIILPVKRTNVLKILGKIIGKFSWIG